MPVKLCAGKKFNNEANTARIPGFLNMRLHTKYHASIEEIGAQEWAELDLRGDPFVSLAFLAAAERHRAVSARLGWHPRHAALRDDAGQLVGVLPLYLRTHSFGDFSRDWNWPAAFEQHGIRYYPKLVSGIPYTPATGPRFLVRRGMERTPVVRQLIAAALDGAREFGCSSWQCLFVEEEACAALTQSGLLMRRGCQFHWRNRGYRDFDEFLAGFSSEKRKKVKRERRRIAESGLRLEVLHGDAISPGLWKDIYPHYLSTFERYGNHAAFPPEFFPDVSKGLGRGLVVFLAWEGTRVVAAAICYRSDTTLFGRHWGAEGDYHSLHFELCLYQGIEYCIRNGLSRFEPGAQGEHKVSRGFLPEPTWSAFWIADPGMRRMIADYLVREQAAMVSYQDEMAEHAPYRDAAILASEELRP